MAAARNASHRHSYLTYPLQYELFPKDMADLAKANSIRAMAIGFKVLAAMTDMVIGNTQLLQVRAGWLGSDHRSGPNVYGSQCGAATSDRPLLRHRTARNLHLSLHNTVALQLTCWRGNLVDCVGNRHVAVQDMQQPHTHTCLRSCCTPAGDRGATA